MAEPDINGPLVNEPAREAVDSMRGYSAQVWRSVLVWLDLADLERLYLEGAEDIDRIHATVAETIQVKNFRGNVTLRSKDVVAAIDNAWSHQERNPGRSIRFRFLTTAGIGLEQGDPFGNAIPGLELWSRARASNDDSARLCSTAKLKKFLVAEERVFAPLQAFLRVADDAAVWQRLISVIDWDTEADEVPEVVREIKDRLVVLGQSYGVPPADAEKVAADLYEFAWTTATREKDRYLTRAILLRAFCEKTHRSIPQATLGALLAVQQILQAPNRELGAPPIAVGGSSGIIGRPPPLPLRYFVRVDVLADIGCVLAGHSAVVLQGSTGAGKSTLAAGHVTDALAIWGWVDLRGLDGAGLARRLGEIAKDLATEEGLANLTLDDFEIPSDPRPLSAPLARIRMLIRARGGALVITSSQVLPQRLWLALELSPESTLQVRPFTRDDIKAFLAVRGCPEPDPASSWAGIIYLHTQGHAQLVHARIAALEASGFPVPGPLDLTDTPPDVLEARAEGRRLLTTLDSEARSLVYRLSLTVHALQRPQVLAIANQPPAIAEPGLALDRLVGPWLETVVDGFYRVSPLVRDAGMQILGQDWAEAMHGSITRALLGFRTLSPIDVSMVLFHGIAAKDWAALAHLSRGILNSDDATFDALASTAGWFVHVGIGIGAVRPTADEYSLVLIRMLQYRLAAADKDHHTAAAIIDCVDAEIPPVSGNRGLQILRHLFLGHVLIRTEVQLPVSRVLSIGREYAQLSDSLGELRAPLRAEKLDPVMRGPNGEFDIGMIASFALALRISDRTALSDLLQVCDPLDPMEVRRLLWFIGNREPVAWAMFERVRLSESKSATADWVACSSVCIRAYNFARRLSLAGLAQSAARAIAEITDVNLHDPDDALRLADAMAAEIGWSPSQEDGRASILLRRGDPAGALAIWRRVIPEWGPWDKFDSRQTFSCREAAIAAAQLEKWAEAADLLTAARERVQTGSNPIYEVGLLMDEGYARWMAGDNRTALARLAAGLSALEHLPSDDADERAFALRTRAGHALMWIAANAEGAPPKGYSAPPPGCCSTLELIPRPMPASAPSDALWVYLLQFEFAGDLGDSLLHAHAARLAKTSNALVRVGFAKLQIQYRLRTLAFEDFVEVALDWVEALEACRGRISPDPSTPVPAYTDAAYQNRFLPDFLLAAMLNAIFALVARSQITERIISEWVASATRAGLSSLLDSWLELARGLFVTGTVDGARAIRDQSLGWSAQMLALIRVAVDHTATPVDVLSVHGLLAVSLSKMKQAIFVVSDIEHIVTSTWLRLSGRLFLLRSPSRTASGIQRACGSNAKGWKKFSKVLAAAEDATPARLPDIYREAIRKLAEDS